MVRKPVNKNKFEHRPTRGFLFSSAFYEYVTKIWKSLVDEAEKNNFNLLCYSGSFFSGTNIQRDTIYDLVNIKKIDGIIILSGSFCNFIGKKNLINYINTFKPLNIVSIGAQLKGIPSVLIDNKSGMSEIMVHLIKSHGFKRIAFIRGPQNNPEAEERYKVYKKVLTDYDIPIDKKLITQGDFIMSSSSGATELAILLDERKVTFDALICSNDYIALRAISELNRRGIRVPEDITVTGFDDIDLGRHVIPPLTTVYQPIYKLGEEALKSMKVLLNNEKTPDQIIIPAKMVVRRSCGCFEDMFEKAIIKNKKFYTNNPGEKNLVNLFSAEIINNPEINSVWPDNISEKTELVKLLINIKNKSSREFILFLEKLLIESSKKGIEILSWNLIISIIFNILKKFINNNDAEFYNNLWKKSYIAIGNIAEQINSNLKNNLKEQSVQLFTISNYFNSTFELNKISKLIVNKFPVLGIKSCYVCFYADKKRKYAKFFTGYDKEQNKVYKKIEKKFPSNNLLPDSIKINKRRVSFIIMALFYKDTHIGFIMFEIDNAEGEKYETLTIQLSNALRGIDLMSRIRKHSKDLEKKVKERTIKLENANKSIENANDKLRNLDTLKNDFIANITHDFRSPLTSILNIASLALRFNANIDEENRENYNIIYKSSLRLKNSIDKLLELAKMDAKGIRLKIKKTDPVLLIDQILNFYISSLIGTNIKIIKLLSDNKIDDFYTDSEKFEEIADNIISNAIKFVDHQSGVITVELTDYPDRILIVISDNGPGIQKEKLTSIFNRFEQAHEGRNSLYRGTGIGLAFARQLIEYLKGRIWAQSEGEGTGSKFYIELKKGKNIFEEKDYSEDDVKPTRRDDLRRIIETEIETKMYDQNIKTFFTDLNEENELNWQKGIILIVDDDFNIRNIIMRYLKSKDYKNFIFASNGRQGLDAVYDYSPDLIICDFNMPKMRGDELHNSLLENPKFSEIPFIFLSAVTDENLIIERREKGAAAYLKKPIDEKIFLITVEEQIKKHFEFLKIRQLAAVDELTVLYNRRSIIERLNHELAIRKYRDLSLIFFDIDFFKEINDVYGHQAGDIVLTKIGELIKSSIRNYDIAGRYGGDEFMIILPDVNLQQAIYVAEILRKVIHNTKTIYMDKEISISSSFGVASLKDNSKYIENNLNIASLENIYEIKNTDIINWEKIENCKLKIASLLLKMADMSLYKAKHSTCIKCGFTSQKNHLFVENKCPNCRCKDIIIGRNKVVFFQDD